MLYTENEERKVYVCDWPEEFINKFDDPENKSILEIAFFFICGQASKITTIEEALKFCKA